MNFRIAHRLDPFVPGVSTPGEGEFSGLYRFINSVIKQSTPALLPREDPYEMTPPPAAPAPAYEAPPVPQGDPITYGDPGILNPPTFEQQYGVPETPANIQLLMDEGVTNWGLSPGEMQRYGPAMADTPPPTQEVPLPGESMDAFYARRNQQLEQGGAAALGVNLQPSVDEWLNKPFPGYAQSEAAFGAAGEAVGGLVGQPEIGRTVGQAINPIPPTQGAATWMLPLELTPFGAVRDVGAIASGIGRGARGIGGAGVRGLNAASDTLAKSAAPLVPPGGGYYSTIPAGTGGNLPTGAQATSAPAPLAPGTGPVPPTTPIRATPNRGPTFGGGGTQPPAPPTGGVPPAGAVPPLGTPDEIAAKLIDTVNTARKLTPEQKAARSAELSHRVGGFANVMERAGTQQEAMRSRGMLAGKLPNVTYEAPALEQAEWDVLFSNLARTDRLPPLSRLSAMDALRDLQSGVIPPPSSLQQLERVYPGLGEAVFTKNRTFRGRLSDELVGLLGIPQAMQTFLDASGTLRQAAVLGAGNPGDFWHAMKREAGVLAAPPGQAGNRAQASMDELLQNPWLSGSADRAGLSFEEVGGHWYSTNRMVEAGDRAGGFVALNQSQTSKLVQKIPFMARSQEGMVTILNQLGGRTYAREAQKLWDAGIRDPEQYQAMAKVINHARGFGSFRAWDLISGVNAFYSPRYLSSRLDTFIDPFKQHLAGNHAAGNLAAKNLVSFIGTNAALLELLNQTGVIEVGWNPLDTDFGKAKIGNTRIDPWTGSASLARFVARATAMTASELGVESKYKYRGGMGELVKDFLGGKLGPVPGAVADALGIRDKFPGSPEMLSADKAFETFTPFLVQTIRESIQEGDMGWKGAAIAAPASFLGAGAQTYGAPTDPRDEARNKEAQARGFESWDAVTDATIRREIDASPNVAPLVEAQQKSFRESYPAIGEYEEAQDKDRASVISGGAPWMKAQELRPVDELDKALAAGEISGAQYREQVTTLKDKLWERSMAREENKAYQAERASLGEQTFEPGSFDEARNDFYATTRNKGSYEEYEAAVNEWQARYPQFTKENVAPAAEPFSATHRELNEAKKVINASGWWDAYDRGFDIAKQNPATAKVLGPFKDYDDWHDFMVGAAPAGTDKDTINSRIAAIAKQTGLERAINYSQAYILREHPETIDLLKKWYDLDQGEMRILLQMVGTP